MDLAAEIDRIASTQYGLVTRKQALDAGLTPDAIKNLRRRGDWILVRPKVCRLAGVPQSWEQQVLAAILAIDGFAHSSHSTAAKLWVLRVPIDERIELTTPIERQVRMPGIRRGM